jgi:hypothetical protein
MEHISLAAQKLLPDAVRHLRRQVSSATPTTVTLDAHGMPTDRTICPDCRNHTEQRESCATCAGLGMVCPMCQGGRMIARHRHANRIQTPYRPCDCMVPDIDPSTGQPRRSKDGSRPKFTLDPQREVDLILRYRDARIRDEELIPIGP